MESIAIRSEFEISLVPKVVSVAKPPWVGKTKNRLQRVVIQLGYGLRGTGWMRSLACIGHVRTIPRGRKMKPDELRRIFEELEKSDVEVWLTNHDSVEDLEKALEIAESTNLRNLSVVLLPEDLQDVKPRPGITYYVEIRYPEKKLNEVYGYTWLTGAIVLVNVEDYESFLREETIFRGDVYVDLIPPKDPSFAVVYGKYKLLDKERGKLHPCLAGTLGITPEGYVLPCPAMGNYVVGHISEGVRRIARKKKVRKFWKLRSEEIEGCLSCPLRTRCHDCRALNYNLTLEERGLGFCPIGH